MPQAPIKCHNTNSKLNPQTAMWTRARDSKLSLQALGKSSNRCPSRPRPSPFQITQQRADTEFGACRDSTFCALQLDLDLKQPHGTGCQPGCWALSSSSAVCAHPGPWPSAPSCVVGHPSEWSPHIRQCRRGLQSHGSSGSLLHCRALHSSRLSLCPLE